MVSKNLKDSLVTSLSSTSLPLTNEQNITSIFKKNEMSHKILVNYQNPPSALPSTAVPPVKTKNYVSTAKYNKFNFLAKNLAEQFSKVSNVYFLCIAVLQMFPAISVTNGIPTMLIPLLIVIILTCVGDAYEDWLRHKSDSKENEQKTRILIDNKVQEIMWQDVNTSNIILIRSGETIPADVILLQSKRQDGRAIIETASLDGETTLKFREPFIENDVDLWNGTQILLGVADCEIPNSEIYYFNATLKFYFENKFSYEICSGKLVKNKEVKTVLLNHNNLLPRGSKLINTEEIIGVVAYAGHATKVYKNSREIPIKESKLMKLGDRLVFYTFTGQLVICLLFGIINGLMETYSDISHLPYLKNSSKTLIDICIIQFFTWIILLCNLIPIALYFYMGFTKIVQARHIQVDSINNKGEIVNVRVRNSNLNEELGEIKYIFTDKTGTLTCNNMIFKKCCINGVRYGDLTTEEIPNPLPQSVDMFDKLLRKAICSLDENVLDFFVHLGVNNCVLLDYNDKNEICYSASSTDEGVFLYAARYYNVELIEQKGNSVYIKILDKYVILIHILARFDFSADRKRSSVLCKYNPIGKNQFRYVLFCKGADCVIANLLKDKDHDKAKEIFQVAMTYAEEGYRTLCLAKRDFLGSYIEEWLQKNYYKLYENQQEQVEGLIAELENELELQGCTALEDKLQDDVKDTISSLREAGIKVWMVTGDKQETAFNIAMLAGIVKQNNELIVIDSSQTLLTMIYEDSALLKDELEMDFCFKTNSKKIPSKSILISGECLTLLQQSYSNYFTLLCLTTESVVCFRASPHQKAKAVAFIKDVTQSSVLAIGDGGNDANMILTANVGVGIRGSEGLQAYNVSDYGITEFCQLKTLLLVHGRFCNRRISILLLYILYKSIVFNTPQLCLAFLSIFSGQKLFFEVLSQSYNVLFTPLSCVLFGIFDCDVTDEDCLRNPQLYFNNVKTNVKRFLQWTLNGLWHGFVCFFVPFAMFSWDSIGFSDGYAGDLWLTGTVVYYLVVIVVCVKILIESYSSAWAVLLSIVLSAVAFWAYIVLVPLFIISPELKVISIRLIKSWNFQNCVCLTLLLALSRDWLWKIARRAVRPELYHLIQERQTYKTNRDSIEDILPPTDVKSVVSFAKGKMCFYVPPDDLIVKMFKKLVMSK